MVSKHALIYIRAFIAYVHNTRNYILWTHNVYLFVHGYYTGVMYFRSVGTECIQSTLVISNSKGLSEILRDIRSSTYQVCRIEEKII